MPEKYKNLGTKVDHRKTPRSIVNKVGEAKSNMHVEEKTSALSYTNTDNNEPQHIAILGVSSEIKRMFNTYIGK